MEQKKNPTPSEKKQEPKKPPSKKKAAPSAAGTVKKAAQGSKVAAKTKKAIADGPQKKSAGKHAKTGQEKQKPSVQTAGKKPAKKAANTGKQSPTAKKPTGKEAQKGSDIARHLKSSYAIAAYATCALYVAGSLLFSHHYLLGTHVNGLGASFATPAALSQRMQQDSKSYTLEVGGEGVDLELDSKALGLAFDAAAWEDAAQSQMPAWAWPVRLFQSKDLHVSQGITYDADLLHQTTDSAVEQANEGKSLPTNATIAYDEATQEFVTTSSVPGDALDPSLVYDAVSQAIEDFQGQVTITEEHIAKASVDANDERFNEALEEAEASLGLSFDLMIGNKRVTTVDSSLLKGWLTVTPSYHISGNVDTIAEWTRGELSDMVDTVGTSRVYTRTNDGKRIEVAGGTYGWNMDGLALAELIAQAIESGSSDAIQIPMQQSADVYVHNGQDWGPRYVDVDLSEQYVRFFDDDSSIIVETECVSGDVGQDRETVVGVFALEDKESPKKLIGLDYDEDGEPDYESDVEYWMPFYGGYGLHDALWRDYFGDDVFLYNGSHGCVNLPYYAAQAIYDNINIGDVVVVHW